MDFLTECTKCGKCKEICPSYELFLNESFSPRGRLRLVRALAENEVMPGNALKQRIFSCLLCGACENNCPLNIDVCNFIYKTRAKMKKGFLLYLFKYFSFYPGLFFSVLQLLNSSKHLKSLLNYPRLTFLHRFLTVPVKQKQQDFLQVYTKLKPAGRIAIFSGCSVNYLLPSITGSLIYILNRLNFEVIVPKQYCCGAPLLAAGFKKDAIKLAKKNLKTYKSFNIDGVITTCPTCAHFIENVYKELTGEGISVLKIADLFEDFNFSINSQDKAIVESSAFFHVSCHSLNYVKDADKTINVLKKLGVADIKKKEGCCGFAGLFSFLFEKQSMDILRKKVLEYETADMIISSCPNCLIQFKFAMKDKKIFHYVEVINKILLKGEKDGRTIKF